MTEIDFVQPKKTVGKLISIDILDKIRSEIEETLDVNWSDGLYQALCIINKHLKGEEKE